MDTDNPALGSPPSIAQSTTRGLLAAWTSDAASGRSRLKPRARAASPIAALDTATPALLIRLDWNPAHHATLGAIRSLGRAGVPVHAVLEHPRVPAARSRYLAGVHPWLPAGADPDLVVKLVGELAEQIGGRPVLYPMDDAMALLLAERGAALAGSARFPAVAAGAPAAVADKRRLAELCRRAGVDHPDTRVPDNAADVARAVAELGLPLIAKWSRPWLLTRASGLRSTVVVRRREEAELLFAQCAVAGSPLLLQRWIAPVPGGDRFYHGYFTRAESAAEARGDAAIRADADAEIDIGFGADAEAEIWAAGPGDAAVGSGPIVCRFGAAGRKDLAWPRGAGLTARGTWVPDPQIEAAAQRVVRAAGFTGVVDLDFRLDPATGRYALLDFNPRLGAQFRLFTDPAGLDLTRAVHLDLTGRPVPAAVADPGRRLTVETYDPFGALRPARRVERAWFARDDPAPFPAAVYRSGVRLLGRAHAGRGPAPTMTAAAGAADAEGDAS